MKVTLWDEYVIHFEKKMNVNATEILTLNIAIFASIRGTNIRGNVIIILHFINYVLLHIKA